jgi:hypothetical protein
MGRKYGSEEAAQMDRGLNSGLIQIRPGRAQDMTLQRLAPAQQRRDNKKTIKTGAGRSD